eukprot:g5982.t1
MNELNQKSVQEALAAAGLTLPPSTTNNTMNTTTTSTETKLFKANVRKIFRRANSYEVIVREVKEGILLSAYKNMLFQNLLDQLKKIFGGNDDGGLNDDKYNLYLNDSDGFTLDLDSPFYLLDSSLTNDDDENNNSNSIVTLDYVMEEKLNDINLYNKTMRQLKHDEESVLLKELKRGDGTVHLRDIDNNSNNNRCKQITDEKKSDANDKNKINENVKNAYTLYQSLRNEKKYTREQTLKEMGVTFTFLNTPRTSLAMVKQHLQDIHVENCSLITYRLNLARASNNVDLCLNEKLALNKCKDLNEVLDYYYDNRHVYNPRNIFAALIKAYCPGWEIKTNKKLLNENSIGYLNEIETGIYMCILVEYGIVKNYETLMRFL